MISPSNALRSLRHPNLRIFFAGQSLSLIGTWITNVASAWLVYRLTDSELWLGVAAFSGQIPTALLSPFAGVLADRFDRRKVLLWTQSLSMIQSVLLAALAASGVITVYQVILLNIFQAVVNAFDMPARQAMLPALLPDKTDLTNAVALQAAMFHGARLIGPAIAGLLLAYSGEAICFAVDGVSYGAVIISLTRLRVSRQDVQAPSGMGEALLDGARYALAHPAIKFILFFVSIFALLGTPQITLLPVFAREVFHGGPRLYGLLMACSGVGALLGAMLLASRGGHTPVSALVAPMPMISGLMLLVLAAASSPWVAAPALMLTGFSLVTMMAGCNTMLQLAVDDRVRGRVLSFYALAFLGMMPLGGLLAGAAANRIGAPATVAIGGAAAILLGARYYSRLLALREIASPDAAPASGLEPV